MTSRTYYFSVLFGNFYHGYHVEAKTLASALRILEDRIIKDSFHLRDLVDWTVSKCYTIYSATGKRSHRTLSTVIKGVA